MQTITLFGGPADGRNVQWAGDEFFRVNLGAPVLDFSVGTVEPFRPHEAVYRRSVVTPSVYVYQP